MTKARGRPKKNESENLKTKTKKICDNCKREIASSNFYNTNSVLSTDGKLNICKICVKSMIDYNNMETIYKILQLLDIPFVYSYWRSAKEKAPEDPWSVYIRIANSKMNEFKNGTWKDSKFEPESINPVKLNMDNIVDNYSSYKPTPEVVNRWGKYSNEEYFKLEQFYWDMKEKNKIETPQEETYLKKLALISMKMDIELEAGHYDESKKLGDLFSKYMGDSQFRTMDKTGADRTGGLRGFGQIYAEVEKDDFIPPWEHYRKIKGITQDIVDKTIMHIENFTLKLNKIEKMTSPPSDTPKLNDEEIDTENIVEINDIEVDKDFDDIGCEISNGIL